ncbi:outer membrane lipoprotein-sorting protein [Candidatus Margulisiibacteriota bacterium]
MIKFRFWRLGFVICLVVVLWTLGVSARAAPDPNLTAKQIQDQVENINEPKDQSADMIMTLIDKKGKKSIRKVKMWSMGDRQRIIKFQSPADVKGVGFLVLNPDRPDEKMYLYLPAFKKIRRIAGSSKKSSFMGSDFSYDDIGSTSYSENYIPKRLPDQNGMYVIENNRKPGSDKEYEKMVAWISPDDFIFRKVEFYKKKTVKDKKELVLQKRMRIERVEKINKYNIMKIFTMEDVTKQHKTVMELENIKFDQGLPDSLFTKRYLQR